MSQLLLQRLDALVRLFDFQGQRSALGPDPSGLHGRDVRPEVDLREAVEALVGQAPVVDPGFVPVQLQRTVARHRPRLSGRGQPGPGLAQVGLLRPAAGGVLPLDGRPPEPSVCAPVVAVVHALGHEQVKVPVPGLVVDGQLPGQALRSAQILGELLGQGAGRGQRQLVGQGRLNLAEEVAVGPLVHVGRLPILEGLARPGGHVPRGRVDELQAAVGVVALPLVVHGLGRGALATGTRTDPDGEVIDGHGYALPAPLVLGFKASQSARVSRRETPKCALRGIPHRKLLRIVAMDKLILALC
jgi:hypothetical protein